MTWIYDPDQIETNAKDQVRFLVGDVVESEPLVQDEEIYFALSQHKQNIHMAAAMVCDSIAAQFSRLVDSTTGDLMDSYSQRAKAYAERAQRLREEGRHKALVAAKPFAGGIATSDKQQNEQNPNRVKPFFYRGLFGER